MMLPTVAEIVADGIHIHFGIGELEVAEEDAVEVVVVVLACVGEDYVEVLAAFVDRCRETDYLRTCANDDEELESAVVGEFDI